MSPLPYVKITSKRDFGKSSLRIVATPLVLYLTFRFDPFGFKYPIILELVIMISDNTIFYKIPTGYSYWCSHLNETTHIAPSIIHFPTKLSSVLQVYWYPACVLEFKITEVKLNRKSNYTWGFTLSHFRGLFKDYTQPIIVYKLSSPRKVTFTRWIIHILKNYIRNVLLTR